ncbi:hypothetical protein F4809DRAFT_597943 [Biscogniauxia mediterranea]|nr:hypothetical protein F4809DRAFT_597943 [Biscogniauxia mediterranea]
MSLGSRLPTPSAYSMSHMPVIEENEVCVPQTPLSSSPRLSPPPTMGRYRNPYPRYPPPAYSAAPPASTNTYVPPASPSSRDKGPRLPAKRRKWYRVALLSFFGIAIVVGLAVGLVVGLRRHRKYDTIPPDDDEPAPLLFPDGSYAFITALYDTSTACTSDPDTFRCFPSTVYNNASQGDEAMTTFLWSIREAPSERGQYIISSSSSSSSSSSATDPQPVPQFSNITLALLDSNQDSERLAFEFPMAIAVEHVGATAPTNGTTTTTTTIDEDEDDEEEDGMADSETTMTCYYNDTTMRATIWTRRPAEYHPRGSGGGGGEGFDPWPYAVEVEQLVSPGPDVPDCRDAEGNRVGNLTAGGAEGGSCACRYRNFGLGGS